MRVLIESPINETITANLHKVLNGFYKDIKSTNTFFSYTPYLTLLSKSIKQPYISTTLTIFSTDSWKNILPPEEDMVVLGVCPKEITFDLIIGFKKEIIESEETLIKARGCNLQLHDSSEVTEWFSTPESLMTFLMKKEIEWNTTLIN